MASLNKDVLNIIFEYASTIDYKTCCSVRLTSKRFAESKLIKEHMNLWCFIEGIDSIEDINRELLGTRPKFEIPFIENYLYSDIVLLIGDRDYTHFLQLKSDFISFTIDNFNKNNEMALKLKVSYRPKTFKNGFDFEKSNVRMVYYITLPKNQKIDVCNNYVANITEIFIPSISTTCHGWDGWK